MRRLPKETPSERFCRQIAIVAGVAATGLLIIFVATQRLELFVLTILLYAISAITYQLTRHAKWNRLRRFVYRRSGYTCEKCGVTGVRMVAHHSIPRSQGGADSPENLVCLCENCHAEIHPWLSNAQKYLGPMRLQKRQAHPTTSARFLEKKINEERRRTLASAIAASPANEIVTQLQDTDYWDKRLGPCAICGKKIRGNAERLPNGRWKHHPHCP